MIRKEAEGGAPSTVQMKSYTFWISQIALLGLVGYTNYDLQAHGPRQLSRAFGVESNAWIWGLLFVDYLITIPFGVSAAVSEYVRHTGRHYVEDRLGFAKSGGRDIAFWVGFVVLVATLYIFARFVPGGALSWGRSFVVLLISMVVSIVLVKVLVRIVFKALYGPP